MPSHAKVPNAASASREGRRSMALLALLVVARIALPLILLHPAWEFHRDELLYFAMGDHLAWRMQFPPFIALVARAGAELFGVGVWAARVPAALGGGALTLVVLLLVRRLGGTGWSLGLTWLALLAAPVFVRTSVLMHPVIFDQLWCTVALAGLVLAAHERAPRWWLLVGTALGMGLLTKASAVLYGAVILVVTLWHPALRGQLATRWPWIGAGLSIMLGLPSLLGQWHYGWPFLAQLAVLERTQLTRTSVGHTLFGQLLMLGAASLLAIAALYAAVRSRHRDRELGTPLQVAALATMGLLLIILLRGGKEYYVAPMYPVLIGLGAMHLARQAMHAVRILTVVALTGCGAVLLPLGIPMLDPPNMARYAAALGLGTTTNMGETIDLPQDYADMLGWEAQARTVQQAWSQLSSDEQRNAVIVALNYGRAGAQAVYARAFGLPYPISPSSDFHAWGTGGRTGHVALVVADADARDALLGLFREVEEVGRLADARRVPEERDVRVFRCRGLRRPLRELWPTLGPRWG